MRSADRWFSTNDGWRQRRLRKSKRFDASAVWSFDERQPTEEEFRPKIGDLTHYVIFSQLSSRLL